MDAIDDNCDLVDFLASKEGSESMTSDESTPCIDTDELVDVPKRKRIRKRAMDELAYLKGQVDEYTHQLQALQAKVPDTSSVGAWEGRSRRLAVERAGAEQENQKLKAAVESQLKIVETLVKLVTKRPKLAEEMYLEVGHRHMLPADPVARLAKMHAIADAEYPKWESHFIRKRLLDSTASVIQTNVEYDEVAHAIGFDCAMCRTLNVNVHQCASIVWSMYFLNMDIKLETSVLKVIQRIDDHTLYYHHLLMFGTHTVHNQVVCKRYDNPDHVVIVLQSVKGDELFPYPPNAYVAHETAWLVISNAGECEDKCTIKYYAKGTLPCRASRAVPALDMLSLRDDEPAKDTHHMAFAEYMMSCYRNNLESLSIHVDHSILAVVDPTDTKLTVFDSYCLAE